MPGRSLPLVRGEIYHIFNRGIDHRPTFIYKRDYTRAIETIKFYRFASPPVRLSVYLSVGVDRRDEIQRNLSSAEKLIDLFAYCLMPNHFHFLIKPLSDQGVATFLSQFQNSYTRYFNTKDKRTGPLFLDQFKAVRIETDEQLMHVQRYIHLNPYTSFVVKKLEDIFTYPWSSLKEYFEAGEGLCEKRSVLSYFKDLVDYKQFIVDQASYQRELASIKHLLME